MVVDSPLQTIAARLGYLKTYSCFIPTWSFASQRLLAAMLVSLDRKQSDIKEKLMWGNVGELIMVLCVVWAFWSKGGKHKGLGFFRIPKIITDQGEEYEELTRKLRERSINAVSRGDSTEMNILETERDCGRHFHQGQPAKDFDQFNRDWVPSLNLGKKECGRPKDFKASVKSLRELQRERRSPLNNKSRRLQRGKNF